MAVQVSVLGLYLPPVFRNEAAAPDDHLTAGPNCCVIASPLGRIGGAGGCPGISAGIVSPACVVSSASSAPDDHLTAGPNCRVRESRLGRIGGAGGCPAISAGIVSPASVQSGHRYVRPRRSFHCRSKLPCDGIAQGARCWCWWLSRCHQYMCRSRSRFSGRVYATCPNVVTTDICTEPVGSAESQNAEFRSCIAKSAIRRSANTGLAKHSAMTDGSFPRASKSSRRTSGCFVSRAMRSISACSCSAVIGLCQ